MTDLGTLGGPSSEARSINNIGQIVGYAEPDSGTGSNYKHACIWEGSNISDLGTLGGNDSYAYGINKQGQVVGWATNASGNIRAFLWEDDVMTSLGTLGGFSSEAFSINNFGQVVGYAKNAMNDMRGFIYEDGVMTDLNTLLQEGSGWEILTAYGINDKGWIVGYGVNPDGYEHAYLLTPEPAAPPIANADGPYSIYVGDMLTLNASGSTDDQNNITSYMWDLDDDGTFETDAGGQAIFDVDYAYLESLGFIAGGPYDIHVQVTDSQQQSDTDSSTLTIAPPPVIEAVVDIRPGSCPNPLNVKSEGVLPVAILGSAVLDVTTIDAGSIFLNGVPTIRSGYEDVAGFIADANDCECTTLGPDGYLDLTLKFMTEDIVATFGEVNHDDVLKLRLDGVLYDETPVEGADCVVIRGKHKPINKADINKDGVVNMADVVMVAENWLQSSIVED